MLDIRLQFSTKKAGLLCGLVRKLQNIVNEAIDSVFKSRSGGGVAATTDD